jgi:hypothetical protein
MLDGGTWKGREKIDKLPQPSSSGFDCPVTDVIFALLRFELCCEG